MMEEREHLDPEAEGEEATEATEATPADAHPPGVHEYPILGDTADPAQDEGSFVNRPPKEEREEPKSSRWSVE